MYLASFYYLVYRNLKLDYLAAIYQLFYILYLTLINFY